MKNNTNQIHMTDDQILDIAYENGFLGAVDVIIDRDVAIQFARLVIEAYEKLKDST